MTTKTKNKFTQAERHALVYGLFEVLAPWPPHHRLDPPDYLKDEQHYYVAGRACGVMTWIAIAIAIYLVFF